MAVREILVPSEANEAPILANLEELASIYHVNLLPYNQNLWRLRTPDSDSRVLALTTEFCELGSLDDVVETLTDADRDCAARGLLNALHFLYQHKAHHGALKPSNVLFRRSEPGELPEVVLSDYHLRPECRSGPPASGPSALPVFLTPDGLAPAGDLRAAGTLLLCLYGKLTSRALQGLLDGRPDRSASLTGRLAALACELLGHRPVALEIILRLLAAEGSPAAGVSSVELLGTLSRKAHACLGSAPPLPEPAAIIARAAAIHDGGSPQMAQQYLRLLAAITAEPARLPAYADGAAVVLEGLLKALPDLTGLALVGGLQPLRDLLSLVVATPEAARQHPTLLTNVLTALWALSTVEVARPALRHAGVGSIWVAKQGVGLLDEQSHLVGLAVAHLCRDRALCTAIGRSDFPAALAHRLAVAKPGLATTLCGAAFELCQGDPENCSRLRQAGLVAPLARFLLALPPAKDQVFGTVLCATCLLLAREPEGKEALEAAGLPERVLVERALSLVQAFPPAHPHRDPYMTNLCRLLAAMPTHIFASRDFAVAGGFRVLVRLLEAAQAEAEAAPRRVPGEIPLEALLTLSEVEEARVAFSEAGCIPPLTRLLRVVSGLQSPSLARGLLAVLCNLTASRDCRVALAASGVADLLARLVDDPVVLADRELAVPLYQTLGMLTATTEPMAHVALPQAVLDRLCGLVVHPALQGWPEESVLLLDIVGHFGLEPPVAVLQRLVELLARPAFLGGNGLLAESLAGALLSFVAASATNRAALMALRVEGPLLRLFEEPLYMADGATIAHLCGALLRLYTLDTRETFLGAGLVDSMVRLLSGPVGGTADSRLTRLMEFMATAASRDTFAGTRVMDELTRMMESPLVRTHPDLAVRFFSALRAFVHANRQQAHAIRLAVLARPLVHLLGERIITDPVAAQGFFGALAGLLECCELREAFVQAGLEPRLLELMQRPDMRQLRPVRETIEASLAVLRTPSPTPPSSPATPPPGPAAPAGPQCCLGGVAAIPHIPIGPAGHPHLHAGFPFPSPGLIPHRYARWPRHHPADPVLPAGALAPFDWARVHPPATVARLWKEAIFEAEHLWHDAFITDFGRHAYEWAEGSQNSWRKKYNEHASRLKEVASMRAVLTKARSREKNVDYSVPLEMTGMYLLLGIFGPIMAWLIFPLFFVLLVLRAERILVFTLHLVMLPADGLLVYGFFFALLMAMYKVPREYRRLSILAVCIFPVVMLTGHWAAARGDQLTWGLASSWIVNWLLIFSLPFLLTVCFIIEGLGALRSAPGRLHALIPIPRPRTHTSSTPYPFHRLSGAPVGAGVRPGAGRAGPALPGAALLLACNTAWFRVYPVRTFSTFYQILATVPLTADIALIALRLDFFPSFHLAFVGIPLGLWLLPLMGVTVWMAIKWWKEWKAAREVSQERRRLHDGDRIHIYPPGDPYSRFAPA
ncbi:hypothetical protein PAPYR_2732 [Paratrimastix pyriformis]|uniref:Protein kinase domain-containing protein n=1 Tax=Paratrimastix pyriformis TaxID=342808 RepID=A0ABQ8URD9_9EUKA|nr:hypothetical protein PAPYR_2732 [Paratrimastix pyriformis]